MFEPFSSASNGLMKTDIREKEGKYYLDINLPGKSGYQILREVKRRSAIPIVVLTSRDQLPDELHALELGADDYIVKPFNPMELKIRVKKIIP